MYVKSIEKIVISRRVDQEKQKRIEKLLKLEFHMENYGLDGYAATCPICNSKNSILVRDTYSIRYHCKYCDSYFYPLAPVIGGDK